MRDVTERQKLQQVKDDFVATVSHELRTPLTSIRGSLGLIVSNAAGELPPKAKTLLDIAHKNTIRLIDLVNDLLDIEKIETHQIEMEKEQLDFGKLVRSTVEANQGFAGQFSTELVFKDETTREFQVLGNPGRLQQVLSNLISNAIKFTPAGKAAHVTLRNDEETVTVEVRDFGSGIPESFKPHLFKRFAQADSGNTRRSRGTGLGLSIVKAIVERHDGTIDFESPLPDGGTRFWLTLPIIASAPPPAETIEDHRPCVLICEDDVLIGAMLANAVEQDGWRPIVANSAEEALRRLAKSRFAAMTVDLGLPDMSGIELIRNVRSDERHHLMPIIVVSADSPDRRIELGDAQHQVLEWLTKPVTETTLRKVLDACVHHAGKRHILHVEDDPDTVVIVREILRNVAGDTVQLEVALSLRVARELLEQRRFDLVVLDVNLPDGNGLDLVPLLRTTNRQAALLILSAEDVRVRGHVMIQASLNKARMENDQLAAAIGRLLAETRHSRHGEDQDGHRAA
jgi:DNA-binding response OmpR family regulator